MKRLKCRKCGDNITLTKDTQDLLNEGYLELSAINICDECFDMEHNTDFEYEQYSDADPGL